LIGFCLAIIIDDQPFCESMSQVTAIICSTAVLFAGCQATPERATGERQHVSAIRGATFSGAYRSIPYFGDLWPSTWADDDRLYLSWGDGTGRANCIPTFDGRNPGTFGFWEHSHRGDCIVLGDPGHDEMHHMFCQIFDCGDCLPLCPFTTAGLLALDGPVPEFHGCEEASCVVSLHVPAGRTPFGAGPDPSRNDKPSSLLFLDGRLLLAGHRPSGEPTRAYLAYSDDHGRTFTEVEESPWTGPSPFLVAMMVQMGRAYELNRDGYVYALAIEKEAALDATEPQPVYLWRVERPAVLDYDRYEYFTGRDAAGEPTWHGDPARASPLPGLGTYVQGSAMYHEGTGRYLFLSGATTPLAGAPAPGGIQGALFEARHPWGPWRKVAGFPGGTIATLIPKGAGPRHVYFTAAGGTVDYNLHVGRLELDVR
jgi:hypothetical protein